MSLTLLYRRRYCLSLHSGPMVFRANSSRFLPVQYMTHQCTHTVFSTILFSEGSLSNELCKNPSVLHFHFWHIFATLLMISLRHIYMKCDMHCGIFSQRIAYWYVESQDWIRDKVEGSAISLWKGHLESISDKAKH